LLTSNMLLLSMCPCISGKPKFLFSVAWID
jgi:hypothetical protein